MRPIHIFLKGYFGVANYGDDILLKVAYEATRQAVPEALITIIAKGRVDYYEKLLGVKPDTAVTPPKATVPHIMVYAGGTQYFGYSRNKFKHFTLQVLLRTVGYTAARGLLNTIRFTDNSSNSADWSNARYGALGLGLGPFVLGSGVEWEAASLMARCDYIQVRDAASKNWLERWRISPSCTIETDLCFAVDLWHPGDLGKRQEEDAQVGIVLGHTGFHGEQGWIGPLRKAIEMLRADGIIVNLYSLCKGEDEELLRSVFGKERILVYEPLEMTLKDVCKELNVNSTIVSARVHGSYVAGILGKSVIVIAKEQKHTSAAMQLGSCASLWGPPFDAATLYREVRYSLRKKSCQSEQYAEIKKMMKGALGVISTYKTWLKTTTDCVRLAG